MRELLEQIEELKSWIVCLERSVAYAEEHDLKDEEYHKTKVALAKAKGRLFYSENLAKGKEEKKC